MRGSSLMRRGHNYDDEWSCPCRPQRVGTAGQERFVHRSMAAQIEAIRRRDMDGYTGVAGVVIPPEPPRPPVDDDPADDE